MDEFNQTKKRTSSVAIIGGYGLLNMDILSKCVWPFLSIKDVNSVSLVCTEWKDSIYQSDEVWEGLIVQLYPSHNRIPTGWCTNGRQEYLRRIRLMKNQYMPVRDLEGLPVPLQLKTPRDVLLDRWNIKEERDAEIIIMVDVFTGRNHFDDDPPYEPKTVIRDVGTNNITRLTNITPVKSTLGRHVNICSSSAVANTGSTLVKFIEERQLPSVVTRETSAAIKYVQDKFKNIDFFAGRDGLYVEMNYYVSGKSVPSHNPIPLLSEHHTCFAYEDDDDSPPSSVYRTDIATSWLPHHRDLGKSTVPHCDNQQEVIAKTRISTRHYTRYGNVPLPFDPVITVLLSPVGKLFVKPEDYFWSDRKREFPFENDNAGICSVFVEAQLSIGEDKDLNFKEFVLPSLLSLWNDASRYSKRRR